MSSKVTSAVNWSTLESATRRNPISLTPHETAFLSQDEITALNQSIAQLNAQSLTLNHLIQQAKARHQNAQAITLSLV